MAPIIQWNSRGLKINLIEITLLVQALLPVVCLFVFFLSSKNSFEKSYTITLKIYSVYSTYVDEDERAAGSSTILVLILTKFSQA